MTFILDSLKEKFGDQEEIIDAIKDNHKYIFDNNELNEQFAFLKILMQMKLMNFIKIMILKHL